MFLFSLQGAVAWIDKVRFYPNEIKSKTKFHIVVGHTAVMATLTFFALPSIKTATPNGRFALASTNCFQQITIKIYNQSAFCVPGSVLCPYSTVVCNDDVIGCKLTIGLFTKRHHPCI